jgi:putative sigma-54 modulation protein
MKVEIVQKNYDMSENLREIILKKCGRLSKYFRDDTVVKAVLKKEKDVCKMEITASVGGSFIRSEASGENMYANIDVLLPKIEKQVLKNKEKLRQKFKENAFKDPDYLYLDEKPEFQKPNVVRQKAFEVYPKAVEDAIDEMNMLDHDFYVFINEKSGKLQIVYRRGDGDVGVLEPVLP